jgi:hypothetical protein
MSAKTRIAFLTYGFFKSISKSDPRLSRWAAVVLDEVGLLLEVITSGLHRCGAFIASVCETEP